LRTEFKGVLYPVIMLEREADELVPKVLEINVRECDPGAQAKLPRLETDIFDVSTAILDGELKDLEIKFSNNCCVAVCAVSGALKGREGLKPGYPADHYTNQPIKGIDEAMNHAILYANGISKADSYRTTGGRVITVVGCDLTFDGARSKAYSAIERIKFPGMKYRRTIEPNTPE
jgi:phosphoribosylamine--glycine ligase